MQRSEGAIKILVVEDDPGIALLERRRLERAGYVAVTAESAGEALERVEAGDIDLIVLDHSLPGGISGLEFYAQLKAIGHDLPVIIVTGNSSEATVIRALRLGVRDFVTKSVEYLDYLPEAVARVLAQVRTERQLDASERRFRTLVQNSSDGIVALDAAGTVQYASPAVERILGYAPDELLAAWGLSLVHPEDQGQARRLFASTIAATGQTIAEVRVRHRDGGWRDVEMIGTSLVDQPNPTGIVINFRDVTERKELERQLAHQAFHDALTGLPNRVLFMDRLNHALLRAQRHGERLAILFLDLDRFKVVNDSLGHLAGDELLRVVATRLRDCVRSEDTVARLGGDEFTVLMEAIPEGNAALRLAGRIATALGNVVRIEAQEVFITTSIGIALSSPESANGVALLRDADVALYRAKHDGRARCQIFDSGMGTAVLEKLALETDLHRAVIQGGCTELRVHYQPKVDLATGRATHMEALVRWQHPARGLVPPGEFIALAEETGLIVPLGRWVLGEACRQFCIWSAAHPAVHAPALSVNLSARQFHDPDLVVDVAAALAASGLAPQRLMLEVTESVAMERVDEATATLEDLRALGVGLALDDFGTGHSSLAYLQRLPLNTLKIDRSFFRDTAQNRAIVGAVTALAHGLGLEVVAEGLETAGQVAWARAAGCDRGQGYYFARPLSPEEVEALWAAGLTFDLPAGTLPSAGLAGYRQAESRFVAD